MTWIVQAVVSGSDRDRILEEHPDSSKVAAFSHGTALLEWRTESLREADELYDRLEGIALELELLVPIQEAASRHDLDQRLAERAAFSEFGEEARPW